MVDKKSKAEEWAREAREMREMAAPFPRDHENCEFWLNQARIREDWAARERGREGR